jgi:L-aspartate oxidase
VCGESACTGAHGANRLASNSLLEGLVFGARIAEHIAKHLPELHEPYENEKEKTILLDPAIRIPLQLSMSEGAGVMRSEKSLTGALLTLEELSKRKTKAADINSWEVSNLYFLATAIVRSALTREESRGSHWRSDFPEVEVTWQSRIVQHLDVDGAWSTTTEVVQS